MTTTETTPLAFTQDIVAQAVNTGASEAMASTTTSSLFEINFEGDKFNLIRTTLNSASNLTLFRDSRKGAANFNGTDENNVNDSIGTALEAMKAALPDEAVGICQGTSTAPAHFGDTDPDREQMGDNIRQLQSTLKERWPDIQLDNCHYDFRYVKHSFANSAGVTHEETRGMYTIAVMWTGRRGTQTTSFNYSGMSQATPFVDLIINPIDRLLDETCRSFDAKPVPKKFTGTLIFTPESLGDLTGPLCGSLSGYELITGTTPFRNAWDTPISNELFTLRNSPRSSDFIGGSTFDAYGVPTQDIVVVENGVLKNFLIDFYTSRKLDRPQTAGALNLNVDPGTSSIDEMIRNTKRGIIMGRFSGGQPNNNLDFSGIAKNSFYVEDGEIKGPLIETMVSGNLAELLKSVTAVSKETVNDGTSCSPWVATEGATIASA